MLMQSLGNKSLKHSRERVSSPSVQFIDYTPYVVSACLTDATIPSRTPVRLDFSGLPFNISWRPAVEQNYQGYDGLAALSDSNNNTCLILDHNRLSGSHVFFIGSLPMQYRSLYVTVPTSNRSLHFQGDDTCNHYASSLLSHVGPKSGQSCHPFCGVPTTCDLMERHETHSTTASFYFECLCGVQSCTEILLWLWQEPVAELPADICEIEVTGYN